MQLLLSFPLTSTSLLFYLLVPFLYFISSWRFRGDTKSIKNLSFLILLLATILAGLAIFKRFNPQYAQLGGDTKIFVAHLAPLLLTYLIILGSGSGAIHNSAGSASKSGGSYHPHSANREIENLTWDDLIVADSLKEELLSVVHLLRDPRTANQYGIDIPKGILLTGPPGTGKTTIAKVIANTANLSFFVLSMDEVVSMWIGESEKNLSALFKAAERRAPAVIFIDEVDSIGKARTGGGTHQWAENLLNHLLQLIDGVIKTEGLYIVAATNRGDLVDAALKRAGRLSRTIEVPLPDYEARLKLFALYLSKLKLGERVDLSALAEVTSGRSGADIKEICNRAGLAAFKRETGMGIREYTVTNEDLERALNEVVSTS